MANNSCLTALYAAGITHDDAAALRRISMTLHRWHELECGYSNKWNSWCLVRGDMVRENNFVHADDGKPFLEVHAHNGAPVHYDAIPDRERGALKRLAAIMARYPGFVSYVQGDPRGCALYILPPNVVDSRDDPPCAAGWLEANYTRGIAVYK